jgi:TPR repeat protein
MKSRSEEDRAAQRRRLIPMPRSWLAAIVLLCAPACHAPSPAVTSASPSAQAEPDLKPQEVAELILACQDDEQPAHSAIACLALAVFTKEGIGGAPNAARAEELQRRAGALLKLGCDAGDTEACSLLGAMLAVALDKQDAGSPKAARYAEVATSALTAACRGGRAFACTALGDIYQHGRGVPANRARARELYQRACRAGEPDGCFWLAALEWTDGDPTDDRARLMRARSAYERACDAGSRDGCEWAAYLHLSGTGGLPKDLDAALPLYRRACTTDHAAACLHVGTILLRHHQADSALQALDQSCKGGEPLGCELADTVRRQTSQSAGPF